MRVLNHSTDVTPPIDFALSGTTTLVLGRSTNATYNCTEPGVTFQHSLYAVTYTIIFIPGLLTNSVALWVLCKLSTKQKKNVVFMVNLAVADLAHVLSLPLRIYYYINYMWPFGSFICQFCFYLKYLNMYASICFLSCISVQRCLFLMCPFKAKAWKRRYDLTICVCVWIVAGAACLPFPLMRSSQSNNACFTDLSIKKLDNKANSVGMVTVAELFGFLIPLSIIVYCTWKTKSSLQDCHTPLQNTIEKQKALRMVATCAIVFFVCFAPYHVMFLFFMMVKAEIIKDCSIRQGILYLHPFCLSLASLNCCFNPILYFFSTSEFQGRISRHSSLAIRARLMSKESTCSEKD
uniref:G-protein coupled receptors family 1 profile domain-containing protein n=1 Tax=Salvator merianae TaxID=96440 RepID=A0A8D0BR57_SALMN